MKILLEAIYCNVQQLGVCGELRMTVMLIGMQGDFTKFSCLFAFGIVALEWNIT